MLVRMRRLGAIVTMMLGLFFLAGCTRTYYRNFADRDTYGILRERLFDWRWRLPPRPVEADPKSRMADFGNPNYEPIPPDERAARDFQISNRFPMEYHGWKKRGMAPIEYLDWQKNIPVESDGKVLLSRDSVMRIAIHNNRDYQTNYETLFLNALTLTGTRFNFMVQGFSTTGILGEILGYGKTRDDQVQLSTLNGFTLQLMTGAQMLVQLANSLVFNYTPSKGFEVATPGLLVNFTQPLLRGAGARIATQGLSLQERAVLYDLRNFAHYRRTFYVNLVASAGYLGLLGQLQTIRNQEAIVKSYSHNNEQYDAEFTSGFKSVIELNQVAYQYQLNQVNLLSLEAGLQTSLDVFKYQQLGLPPELEVRLDDAMLQQFQLNEPRLDAMRTENDARNLRLLQQEKPPRAALAAAAKELQGAYDELEKYQIQVKKELRLWQTRLEAERKRGFAGPDRARLQAYYERRAELAKKIERGLEEWEASVKDDRDKLTTFLLQVEKLPIDDAVNAIRDKLINQKFRSRLSDVFAFQTRIRVFLIELKPVTVTVDQAIQIALANRLDLMNALAAVTDAWRNVEVDANALRGFLNFVYNANFASAPSHTTLFRFDSSASFQQFGFQFQAPINRRAERNQYRADQITYQRARRAYMQLRDQIVQQIRYDMRELTLYHRQFDIAREQILSSSTQVEEAESALLLPSGGQPVTLNLLNALSSLLGARNGLISNWVNYETFRLTLFSQFDLMDIDANGVWTNENDPGTVTMALRMAAQSPSLSLAIPARVPDLSGQERRVKVFFSDIRASDRLIPDESTAVQREHTIPGSRTGVGAPAQPGGNVPAPPPTPSPFVPPARP
ncbi:MAG: TolC family protein [Isosphaeraceae bacterium]